MLVLGFTDIPRGKEPTEIVSETKWLFFNVFLSESDPIVLINTKDAKTMATKIIDNRK